MKKVLMIAAVFPPVRTSGSTRPFQFAKCLPDFGFYPIVLTQETPPTKSKFDPQPLEELKGICEIVTVRPLVFGSWSHILNGFLRFVDIPFLLLVRGKWRISKGLEYVWQRIWRKREWQLLTVAKGFKCFLTGGFDIIWATGPPWSALHAGYLLASLTRKPLIADIRDPWTYGLLWKPPNQKYAKRVKMWERRVLIKSSRIVYTSPLTTEIMRGRSRKPVAERMVTITNGFSEHPNEAKRAVSKDKCLFRHVGKVMRMNREPFVLLQGLRLACQDPTIAEDIRLQFIGTMDGYEEDIKKHGLEKQVEYIGCASYKDSLRLMRGSDVLILLQTVFGEGTDVIAGKAYEYLAARKPILGIVPEDGGDAWLLRSTSAGLVTGIHDPNRISQGFRHYWRLWKDNKLTTAVRECDISQFSRLNLTKELAKLFEEVLDHR